MMLILRLLLLAIHCLAYENKATFEELAKEVSLTEEDISLQHQAIQWEEKLTDVWSEYYAIPWELLNPEDLSEIGLNGFTQLGSYADLNALGPGFAMDLPISRNGLYIPNNTSLLFLFNTSSAYNSPGEVVSKFRETDTMDAAKVMQTSLPFGLPAFHYVVDYTLLVPKPLLSRHMDIVPFQTASQWVRHIGLRRVAIPLSKDMMNNGLVMSFVFRSAKSLEDFVDEDQLALLRQQTERLAKSKESPIRKAKNYIAESLLLSQSEVAKAVISSSTKFFDNFALRWVGAVGYESLLYSTFCQVNCKYHEQSYCLKFKEGQHATVSLLNIPQGNFNSKIQKRSEDATTDRLRETYGDKAYKAIGMIRELMIDIKSQAAGYAPLSIC